MLVIGVVGGVASGKSLVAEHLERLGAARLDADRAGHEALRNKQVIDAIVRRWGAQVLDASGQIDRRKVAEIVFGAPPDSPRELAWLEQLTHPLIGKILKRRIDEMSAAGHPAVVLDAPVMLKAGWDEMCDVIVFVDAPAEQRLARARRRGWDESQWSCREASQIPVEEKRRRADEVIDNSGSPERTRAQVEQFWRRWHNAI